MEDVLGDIEQARQATIRKNEERLKSALGVGSLELVPESAKARTVQPSSSAPRKGLKRPRKEKDAQPDPPPPTRRSLRNQGQSPDAGGIREERRDRSIVLEQPPPSDASPASTHPKRPTGALALQPENRDDVFNDHFMHSLAHSSSLGSFDSEKASSSGSNSYSETSPFRSSSLASASLSESDVAKIVPKGIVHMDFLPSAHSLVLASGDKGGAVGIWKVGIEDEADGLWLQRCHGQYVSGLRWSLGPSSPRLLTCSYDGAIRSLDPEKQSWDELYVSNEGGGLSAFDLDNSGSVAFASDGSGSLARIDLRAGNELDHPLEAHRKKINTIHVEPVHGTHIVTSSTDAICRVWDVRTFGKSTSPIAEIDTKKSCQAALFSPTGDLSVLTISYNDLYAQSALDRTYPPSCRRGLMWECVNERRLQVWEQSIKDESEYRCRTSVRHNNQTGRWLLPLRPTWTPDGASFVVGSMKRETEVIDSSGKYIARLHSDYQTAVCSRHAVHPLMPVVAAGTASGRAHVWRASDGAR